jgi:polysaccharide export outer membrane protein
MRTCLAAAALVVGACVPPQPATEGARTVDPPPPQDAVGLGPFDVVEVRVFEPPAAAPPKMEVTVAVGADGTLVVPLAGSVEVAGKQPSDVDTMLTLRFKQNGNPGAWVSTLVREVNSRRVTCLGAVQHPGQFSMGLAARPTLVESVALCGGLTATGDAAHLILTRRTKGAAVRYVVALSDILSGKKKDVPLQADDLIYVPERVF